MRKAIFSFASNIFPSRLRVVALGAILFQLLEVAAPTLSAVLPQQAIFAFTEIAHAQVTIPTECATPGECNKITANFKGLSVTGTGASASFVPTLAVSTGGLIYMRSATGVNLYPRGTGAGHTTALKFWELTANGSNFVGFKSPDSITTSLVWVLPSADGGSGQVLKTNGAGVLSWATVAGGSSSFGSGNVITIGNSRYVLKQGDTMTGALRISGAGKGLTASGDIVSESKLVTEGTLEVTGSGTKLRSLNYFWPTSIAGGTGSVLKVAANGTLYWAAIGTTAPEVGTASFSGAVQIVADQRYVKKQGDTMTGSLAISGTGKGLTASGTVAARGTLASSGNLVVGTTSLLKGNATTSGNLVVDGTSTLQGNVTGEGNISARGTLSGRSLTVSSSGVIIANQQYYFPPSRGSGNQVLAIGSNGHLTWITAQLLPEVGTSSFSGAVQIVADTRYVKKQGDTMTGSLFINGTGKGLTASGTIKTQSGFIALGPSTFGDAVADTVTLNGQILSSNVTGAKPNFITHYHDDGTLLTGGNASLYHGSIAHNHSTGKMYYAHGGAWVEIADKADIQTLSDPRYVNVAGDTMTGTLLVRNGNGGLISIQMNKDGTLSGVTIRATTSIVSSGTLVVDGTSTLEGNVVAEGNITTLGTLTSSGNITADNGSRVQLNELELNGNNWVALRSTGALAGNTTYYLPVADGLADQALITGGNGQLRWVSTQLLPEVGTAAFSGAVQIVADQRYVKKQGDTMTGNLVIANGKGVTASGTVATRTTLASSGNLVVSTTSLLKGDTTTSGNLIVDGTSVLQGNVTGEGNISALGNLSGRTLTVSSSGSTLNNVQYYWPTTTLSGGFLRITNNGSLAWSDASSLGDSRYVNVSGDTMTGALTVRPTAGTTSVGVNVAATMSGRSLHISGTGSATTPLIYTNPTTGRVGIGTSTPSTVLDVRGDTDANTKIRIIYTGTPATNAGGGAFQGYISQPPTAVGQRLGNLQIGAFDSTGTPRTSVGVFGFAGEAWGTGTTRSGYLTLETTALGSNARSERVRVETNGNVGIGTSTPSQKLDVLGNIALSGGVIFRNTSGKTFALTQSGAQTSNVALKLPTGTGSAGQVLTTSTSGQLSWTTPSSTGTGAAIADADNNTKVVTYPNDTIKAIVAGKDRLTISGAYLTLSGNTIPVAASAFTSLTKTLTTPDSTGNVGAYSSMKIGTDNLPVVAYYDVTNQDLKVIKCGNATCTSGNTTTTVDATGSVGVYASLAIGTDGFPVIAYSDSTNSDLKVAKCTNADCSASTITSVDTAGSVGTSISIAIGTDSFPVISYLDSTSENLKVAKCGNASCSSGNTITTVESTNDVGYYSQIAIGADGFPVIAHLQFTAADLRVLKCGNAACTSGNSAFAVDTGSVSNNGFGIAIGTDSYPIITYNEGGALKVAKCSTADCSSSSISTVDSSTDISQFKSMTIGADGFPIISYGRTGAGDFYIAKCGNAACSSGNTLTSIDATNDVGNHSSIVIAASGYPIATYYDNTSGDLKLVSCVNATCAATTGGSYTAANGYDAGSPGNYFRNIYASAIKLKTPSGFLTFTGVGNPSLDVSNIHDTDNNTKIQSEENTNEDILRFDTNGVERLTINAAGRLTIMGALTLPVQKTITAVVPQDNLDVGTGTTIRFTGQAGSKKISGIASGTDGRVLSIINASTGSLILQHLSGGSLNANRIITGTAQDLTIAASGALLLQYDGTAQKWRAIGGTGSSGGSSNSIADTDSTTQITTASGSTETIIAKTSGAQRLNIDGNGRILFNTPVSLDENSVFQITNATGSNTIALLKAQGDKHAFTSYRNSNTGAMLDIGVGPTGDNRYFIWAYGSKPLDFGTNATQRMRITSGGLIGIGTTTPTQKLDVRGNLYLSGAIILASKNGRTFSLTQSGAQTSNIALRLPTGTGSLGQVLTTSPSGQLSWTTPSSGGSTTFQTVTNANATATDWGYTVLVTAGAATRTITLPTAVGNTGKFIEVKKVDTGTGTVYIDGFGTQNIDGSSGTTLTSFLDSAVLRSDGTNVRVVSSDRLGSNYLAEYGENNGITHAQTNNTTGQLDQDVAGSAFTLPSAGVWEVQYVTSVRDDSNTFVTVAVADGSSNVVSNSRSSEVLAEAGEIVQLTNTVRITTTGPEAYKLVWARNGGAGTSTMFNNNSVAGSGVSKITWKKISGFIPVTGQSVDYGYVAAGENTGIQTTYQTLTNIPVDTVVPGTAFRLDLDARTQSNLAGISVSNDQLVISRTGTYEVIANTTSETSTARYLSVQMLIKNGATILAKDGFREDANLTENPENSTVVWTGPLTAGDTIDVRYAAHSGGTNDLDIMKYQISVKQIGSSAFTSTDIWSTSGNSNVLTGTGVLGTTGTGSNAKAVQFKTNNSVRLTMDTAGRLVFTSVLAVPTSQTVTAVTPQNNLALSTGSTIRFTGGAASKKVTGFAGGTDGRILFIQNASTGSLILQHLSGGSLNSNRIITGTAQDLTVSASGSVLAQYDGTAQKWRIIGGTGGSSGTGTAIVNGTTRVTTASGNTISMFTTGVERLRINGAGLARFAGTISGNGLSIKGVSSFQAGGTIGGTADAGAIRLGHGQDNGIMFRTSGNTSNRTGMFLSGTTLFVGAPGTSGFFIAPSVRLGSFVGVGMNPTTDALSITGSLALVSKTGKTFRFTQSGAQTSNISLKLPTGTGSAGQVLSTSTGGQLSWVSPSGSTTFQTVTNANATVTDWGYTVVVTTGAASRTITLPTAVGKTGKFIEVKKLDSGTGSVYIDGFGSEEIDTSSGATISLEAGSMVLRSDGTNVKLVSAVNNVVSETGEVTSAITTGQTINSTVYTDVTGSTFTLPSAGTYHIEYTATASNASGNNTRFRLATSGGTPLPYSYMTTGAGTAGINQTSYGEAYVTITSPTTYVMQWNRATAGASTLLNDENIGSTQIKWKKISGFLPVAGQSVDFAYAEAAASQSLSTINTVVAFSTNTAGNIPNSSGVWTLTAGKTYELDAFLATSPNTSLTNYQWYDITNATYLGSVGSTGNQIDLPSVGRSAQAIFTPSTNVTVHVRTTIAGVASPITSSDAGDTNGSRLASRAIIKQLGTTALAGSPFLQNGNSFNGTGSLGTNDNYALSFKTSNTNRMTLTTSGILVIGSTFPVGQEKLAIVDSVGNSSPLSITRYSDNNSANFIVMRGASGSELSPVATSTGEVIAGIGAIAHTGTAFETTTRAWMRMYTSQKHTTSKQGTYIAFATTPDNSTSAAERLRISQAGNVGIGTTAPAQLLHVSRSGDGVVARFTDTNGDCDINPTSTALVCSSDIRLKKDYIQFSAGLPEILRLNAIGYHWSNEDSDNSLRVGFGAQQVREVLGESFVTFNESKGTMGLNFNAFTPLLVKGIQDVNTKVDIQAEQIKLLAQKVGVSTNELDDIKTKFIAQMKAENDAHFAVMKSEWNTMRAEYEKQFETYKDGVGECNAITVEKVAEPQPSTEGGEISVEDKLTYEHALRDADAVRNARVQDCLATLNHESTDTHTPAETTNSSSSNVIQSSSSTNSVTTPTIELPSSQPPALNLLPEPEASSSSSDAALSSSDSSEASEASSSDQSSSTESATSLEDSSSSSSEAVESSESSMPTEAPPAPEVDTSSPVIDAPLSEDTFFSRVFGFIGSFFAFIFPSAIHSTVALAK